MTRIIGTSTLGYNEVRNISGLPFSKYQVVKKQHLNKLPAHLYFKWKGAMHKYYWYAFRDFDLNNVAMYHFFNSLSFGKKPWVTTFETAIPRWGDWDNRHRTVKGLRLIAGNPCKKIIAMSDCNAQIQRRQVEAHFPAFSDVINEKLMVLHPPQKPLIDSVEEKPTNKDVVFTIVGSDFFRKGGREVLQVFDHLFKAGKRNWRLNIISKMQYGDYASRATSSDLAEAERIINRYPHNVFHARQLPNKKVLTLLKDSDVALLPTYGDTYGYSVLEAQAAGCPVITTNIRALPEINNNEIGWMIEVPKDEMGNGVLDTPEERQVFSTIVFDQLYAIIESILSQPDKVLPKGIKSLQKIRRQHSITHNTAVLENLYDEILQEAGAFSLA